MVVVGAAARRRTIHVFAMRRSAISAKATATWRCSSALRERARPTSAASERALVQRAVGVGDARKLAERGGGLDLHANVLRLREVVQQLEAALGEEERHAGLLRADRRARVRHLARDRRVDAGDADAVDHRRDLAGAEGALLALQRERDGWRQRIAP